MTTPAAGSLRLGTAAGRWVLAATVLGSGLAMLDATVVNVALARIGTAFGAGFAGLQWTVNAYTLTLASLILLAGSLGDRFGRRHLFVIGVGWFASASLLCAVAPSVEVLIAARAVQGVGGALLTPGSLAIISASFAPGDRAAAIGAWSGLGGLAGAVGPFVGGALVDLNWRAVFLVNLPVAVVLIVIARRHVPESRDPQASPHLDLPGSAFAVLGLAGITYALTLGTATGFTPGVAVAAAVGTAGVVGFVAVERRSEHPLIPLDVFANRQFTAANVITVLIYAALGTVFLLLVLEMQVVAGFGPVVAGTALLPITALMLALSARAGALAARIGPRLPLTVGYLVCAGGLLLMLRVGPNTSYLTEVLPAVVVFGLGLTLTVAPLTATVLGSADARHAGVASGVNNAVSRAAGLLAVAVIPSAAGIAGGDYTDPAAFDAGFHTAMIVCAALLAAGAVGAALLIRRPLTPAGSERAPADEDRDRAAPLPARSTGALPVERFSHCAVTGSALHPRTRR